jgi:hypothetical protein
MSRSTSGPTRMSCLAAAGSAAVVAIGLVTAPNAVGPHIPRPVRVPAIQLQAVAGELTSVALHANTALTRSAAAIPQANASGPTPDNVFRAVLAVALTPLWYAAFPITLPASVALAVVFVTLTSCLGGCGRSLSTTPVLQLGLRLFALGPLTAVEAALKALVPLSSFAAADASPVAESSTASQASRQDHRAKGGLAGSRRTASASTNVDRKPTAHRTTKSTPTHAGERKHPGTAGSGRAASKNAQS